MKWKEKGCLSMNKTTQKYFINLFKRKKRILALYTFIVFMAYPFLLITNLITNDGKGLIDITQTMLVLCELALAALAIILPLFTFKFAFVKKKCRYLLCNSFKS